MYIYIGNNIVALPVELSRPFRTNMDTSDRGFVSIPLHTYTIHTTPHNMYNYTVLYVHLDTLHRQSLRMRFAALETLWLDDNKLTDQTTFSTLAGLRK